MDKQPQRLKSQKPRSQDKVNKRDLVVGSLIATFIAITPYLFTIWESVPDQRTWDTFLFSYTSPYYESVQIMVWTLLNKIIPLLLLIIWVFTCRQWWYHVLFVPIAMYIYQIMTILNDDLVFADKNQILYLLPIMAIVIPSIYLTRAKMFNRINEADKSMEDLEEEFKIKPKFRFRDYF